MRSALALIASFETQMMVRQSLEGQFNVVFHSRCEDAAQSLAQTRYDLVLVDLSFDEDAGLAFGESMRNGNQLSSTLLVFLTNVRDTRLLVRAFDVGGDELIHTPFQPEEIQVRIGAHFRRMRAQPVIHDLFWRGDLRFSPGTQRVVSTDAEGENDLELTPNEFKILYLLARNEGRTLSRQTILQEVWGENLHVVERTVDKHICSLRRKMRARSHYVASVPGAGYCFSATSPVIPVEISNESKISV